MAILLPQEGDIIEVSDCGSNWTRRKLVAFARNQAICESTYCSHDLHSWKLWRAIPKEPVVTYRYMNVYPYEIGGTSYSSVAQADANRMSGTVRVGIIRFTHHDGVIVDATFIKD